MACVKFTYCMIMNNVIIKKDKEFFDDYLILMCEIY